MYKTDIKDSLEECYSKFKMVEGRISGLEDRSIKTFIVKNRKEKKTLLQNRISKTFRHHQAFQHTQYRGSLKGIREKRGQKKYMKQEL